MEIVIKKKLCINELYVLKYIFSQANIQGFWNKLYLLIEVGKTQTSINSNTFYALSVRFRSSKNRFVVRHCKMFLNIQQTI